MVHTNYDKNNVPVVREVAVAWREACNGESNNAPVVREVAATWRKACNGERNNAPTLKMEKWIGDVTVLWVVEKWGNNSC